MGSGSEKEAKVVGILAKLQGESSRAVRVNGIVASRDVKRWAVCSRRIYVLDARSNVPKPIGRETSGARERSGAQATGEGFTVGHKCILAVQVRIAVFADARRRIDNHIAATGCTPEGTGRCYHQEEALHRTPRSASFCAGDIKEAGVVRKPLVFRTATVCAPFCTMRAAK